MKAGRELDALIAEKVMGWKYHDWKTSTAFEYTKYCFICGCTKRLHAPVAIDDFCGTKETPPHYSTQIADAWLVVEKLLEMGAWFSLSKNHHNFTWDCRGIINERKDDEVRFIDHADTAPLAICLAALKTKENDDGACD